MDFQAPVRFQLPLNPSEIQFLPPFDIINLSQITFLECKNTKVHKIILVDYILHEMMRDSVFRMKTRGVKWEDIRVGMT